MESFAEKLYFRSCSDCGCVFLKVIVVKVVGTVIGLVVVEIGVVVMVVVVVIEVV